MYWEDIKEVSIKELDSGVVPVRMRLTTRGGEVTSAGWSVAAAATVLFSTAGLGYHSPKSLYKLLERKFSSRMSESWINELLAGLLEPAFV